MYKLTPTALDIAADYPEGSPEYLVALKTAALKPKIHLELWNKWHSDLPPDDEIRRYLVREKGFNDKTVADFITQYRATISLAKLNPGDKINEAAAAGAEDAPAEEVNVGDFVQWTCNGANMFSTPRPVRALSDDGLFAFVPGTETGLPLDQLTVEQAVKTEDSKLPPPSQAPPRNPFAAEVFEKPKTEQPLPPGLKEDGYDMPEGRAILRWPEKLDPGSVDELEDWFNLIVRKIRRTNNAPSRNQGGVHGSKSDRGSD